MLPDLHYQVKRVREAQRWRAGFDALTNLPRRWVRFPTDVTAAAVTLRAAWHAKVVELSKAGWQRSLGADGADGAIDWSKVWYLRNCPPFGVTTGDRAYPCRSRFCPFCWGRAVVGHAFQLERYLFQDGLQPWAKPWPGVRLYAYREVVKLPLPADDRVGGFTRAWAQWRNPIWRRRLARAANAGIAALLHHPHLTDEGAELVRGGVFLLDEKSREPKPRAATKDFKSFVEPPTRSGLATLCAEAFAYPGPLWRLSAADAVALDAELKNARLWSTVRRRGLKSTWSDVPVPLEDEAYD